MEWENFKDEYGMWKTNGVINIPVELFQKWHDEHPIVEPEQLSPTETELLTDYIIDVDYRVTMIELGL